MPCKPTTERPLLGLAVSAFRPQRRWQLDHLGHNGYAHKLPPAAQRFLARFNREEYGADNEFLKPSTHLQRCAGCRHQQKCRACKRGQCANPLSAPCKRKPPARPLNRSRKQRCRIYVAQNAAHRDAMSMGRVDFIEDMSVDATGERAQDDTREERHAGKAPRRSRIPFRGGTK